MPLKLLFDDDSDAPGLKRSISSIEVEGNRGNSDVEFNGDFVDDELVVTFANV